MASILKRSNCQEETDPEGIGGWDNGSGWDRRVLYSLRILCSVCSYIAGNIAVVQFVFNTYGGAVQGHFDLSQTQRKCSICHIQAYKYHKDVQLLLAGVYEMRAKYSVVHEMGLPPDFTRPKE